MDKIITSNDLVYLFRIFLAICAGAVIGYEREHRYKVAGLRTHILILPAQKKSLNVQITLDTLISDEKLLNQRLKK